jgi:RNA polymerase sigma-70 factor (sigma-E family)
MMMPSRLGSDFDDFVNTHSTALLRSAYLLTLDLGHAQDLVQITLVKTARRWSVARKAPEAYSHRVLVNASRDRWRALKRRPQEHYSLSGQNEVLDAASYSQQVVDRETLAQTLRQVEGVQREVIVLRYFLDLTVAKTAEVLQLPEGTVKSHAARGLERMRELLSKESIERGNADVHRE